MASGYEQVADPASAACDITVRDGPEINALQLRHDRMLADILIKLGIDSKRMYNRCRAVYSHHARFKMSTCPRPEPDPEPGQPKRKRNTLGGGEDRC